MIDGNRLLDASYRAEDAQYGFGGIPPTTGSDAGASTRRYRLERIYQSEDRDQNGTLEYAFLRLVRPGHPTDGTPLVVPLVWLNFHGAFSMQEMSDAMDDALANADVEDYTSGYEFEVSVRRTRSPEADR